MRGKYKRRAVTHTPGADEDGDGDDEAPPPVTGEKKFRVNRRPYCVRATPPCQGESPEIFRQIGVGKVRLMQATPDVSLRAKPKPRNAIARPAPCG